MENTKERNINLIKDKIFEECQKMFDADLLAVEGINGWNKKEINEANVAHQNAYNSIIWRLQDYYDIMDDVTEDLNFDDYLKD